MQAQFLQEYRELYLAKNILYVPYFFIHVARDIRDIFSIKLIKQ